MLAVETVAARGAASGAELRQTRGWGSRSRSGVAINALVTRDGATVLFRGPNLPWPGQIDITLEALVYGGVLGLRILVDLRHAAFLAAAVDPDELLRGLRRVSLRSGVTAALAMRLFGVLRARRRAGSPTRSAACRAAARVADAVLHAVTAGALDRATDVAATLEVRGFGAARAPAADAAAVVAPRPRLRRLRGRAA